VKDPTAAAAGEECEQSEWESRSKEPEPQIVEFVLVDVFVANPPAADLVDACYILGDSVVLGECG
jgi:hypothetical protein